MDGTINGADFANFVADDGHSDPVLSGQPRAILVGTLSNVIQGPEDIILGVVSRDGEENFYYSGLWQLIQESSQSSAKAVPVTQDQYVWGQAYVDEMIVRDSNNGSGGNLGIAGSGLGERIIVLDELADCVMQRSLAEKDHAIETLGFGRFHPAFRERVQVGGASLPSWIAASFIHSKGTPEHVTALRGKIVCSARRTRRIVFRPSNRYTRTHGGIG